ncbi:ABC transporter substrate-binding protein [Streptococcus parasanguinis]|uniref:ABC transporter substrate-binding protein n=1 Tax=Streptococcus parasanguinis TaxID=1318 RepID=UPI0039C4ADFE
MLVFKGKKGSWVKLCWALLLAGIFLLALKAFQGRQNKMVSSSDTVTMGYTQFPANIDPVKEYNGWFTVRYGVGETLFKMDDQLQIQPWLATKGEQLSPLEWEITIRQGVRFHDGSLMTPQTVKESLEHLLASNQRASGELKIEQMTATDQTLRIKTKEPQPILLNLLADPYSTILHVGAKESTGKSVVATGPYQLTAFRPENGASLKAFGHYWNGTAKVAKVEIRSFSDATSMSLALDAGEIDAAYGMPALNLASYRQKKGYRISEVDGSRYLSYVYNFRDHWMQDKTLRKAIDLVIDRKAYSQSLFQKGSQATSGPFPSRFPFALEEPIPNANAKEAEKLLDQAGYLKKVDGFRYKDGKKVTLTALSYERLPEIPLAVQATQAALKKIGIDVKIRTVEVGSIAAAEDYSFTPYTMVATPVGDPYPFFKSSLASDGSVNLGKYKSNKVDQLIKTLGTEGDQEKRQELSKDLQREIQEDLPISFLVTFKVAVIMNDRVSGLTSSASDYYHITNQLTKE